MLNARPGTHWQVLVVCDLFAALAQFSRISAPFSAVAMVTQTA